MARHARAPGPLERFRQMPNEHPAKLISVALCVCLLCSTLVTGSVVLLRPIQEANLERDRLQRIRQIVTTLPGLEDIVGGLGAVEIQALAVDLETGRVDTSIDPSTFDATQASRDPETSVALPAARDPARIGRRARHAVVYIVRRAGLLEMIILPVHGAGYASTLRGYLALDSDTNTVRALTFYEHGETPGLGSEIESPAWLALWPDKQVRDASGAIRIRVADGRVDPANPGAMHEVDAITGATYTSQGVTNLVRFWLGPDGFGLFLERIRAQEN